MKKLFSSKIFLIFFLVLLCHIAFFIFIYPTASDFDWEHVAISMGLSKSNNASLLMDVSFSRGIPGYYAFIVSITELCGLSYDVMPMIPIFLISFLIGYAALINSIADNFLFTLFILIGLFLMADPASYTWGCHGMAFVLFLTIILISIVRIKDNSRKHYAATSVIVIISLISMNFISYKLLSMSIYFIVGLTIIDIIRNTIIKKTKSQKKFNLGKISLLIIVFTLSFNQFFYEALLPTLRISSEIQFSGIEKLTFILSNKTIDPFFEYYYKLPSEITYLKTIRLLILFLLLAVFIIILFDKILKHNPLNDLEFIVISCLAMGLITLIVYNFMGQMDLGGLTLTSILSASLIFKFNLKFFNRALIILIMLFVIIGILINALLIGQDTYIGQKDIHSFEYLQLPANWFIIHAAGGQIFPSTSETDVFTRGYIWKEFIKEGKFFKMENIKTFRIDTILFLRGNETSRPFLKENHQLIINYKEQHLSIGNWNILNSWSKYRQHLKANQYYNLIYSTNNLEMLATR